MTSKIAMEPRAAMSAVSRIIVITAVIVACASAFTNAFIEVIATDSFTNKPLNFWGRKIVQGEYFGGIAPDVMRVGFVGECTLEVHNPLYVTVRRTVQVVENCTTRVQVRLVPITMTRARVAAITGRVTDLITGEPVIGAFVRADSSKEIETYTDTNGVYAIQVRPGLHRVDCYGWEYRKATSFALALGNSISRVNFATRSASPQRDSVLRLLARRRILHLLGEQDRQDSVSMRHNDSLRIAVWEEYKRGHAHLALRSSLLWGGDYGGPWITYLLLTQHRATYIGVSPPRARPLAGISLVFRYFDKATQTWAETEYPTKGSPSARLVIKLTYPNGRSDYF